LGGDAPAQRVHHGHHSVGFHYVEEGPGEGVALHCTINVHPADGALVRVESQSLQPETQQQQAVGGEASWARDLKCKTKVITKQSLEHVMLTISPL